MHQAGKPNSPSMKSIEGLVQRFERRLRLQRIVTGVVEGGALGLMIAGLSIAAVRTGWADPVMLWFALSSALICTAAGALIRGSQPIDTVAAAQQIDRTHGLHDRLSTAISLARRDVLGDDDRAFVSAQLQDALRHVDGVDPRRAAPWKRPPDLFLLGLAGLAVLSIGLLPVPDHEQPLPETFAATYGQVLDGATLAMERDRLNELRRRLDELPDDKAEAIADEIEALLDAVENRQISEREFLEQIEALLQDHFGDDSDARELETLAQALAEAALDSRSEHDEALGEDLPELEQAMEALEEGDFQAASEALAELADRIDTEGIDPDDAERLADFLETFAENLDSRDERLQELFEEHRDTFEELAEQFDNDGGMDEQLLEDARQQAENAQQERDAYNESDARRQLEQLSRELEQTAEELRDQAEQDRQDGDDGQDGQPDGGDEREGPAQAHEDAPDDAERIEPGQSDDGDNDRPDYRNEIGRQLDDVSRQLEEMDRQKQRQQQREQARRQLEEMRESMSRSGGDSEQDQRRGEQMEDYMDRARGEQQEGESQSGGGDDGEEGLDQIADGQGDSPHDGGEGGEDGQGADAAGSGGPEDDDGLLDDGDGSGDDIEFAHRDEQLSGTEGEEGPTRSEIIRSASEEGFATVDYQDVYADYEAIAEEVMEREDVPDGYRYYIKRYFQLIRPAQ